MVTCAGKPLRWQAVDAAASGAPPRPGRQWQIAWTGWSGFENNVHDVLPQERGRSCGAIALDLQQAHFKQ